MRKVSLLSILIFLSCGSRVSEDIPIPGITTGTLDLTVKDMCGKPISGLEVYVSGSTEPLATDRNGKARATNVPQPYSVTFWREGEPPLTYISRRGILEAFDLNSSCKNFKATVTGAISISASITEPVKIFAYPGGSTETIIDNGKGEYSMELLLERIPARVVLAGVLYKNGKPDSFGKEEIQITGQSASAEKINLLYSADSSAEGRILLPQGVNEKLEIEYYFLFSNMGWNDEPVYRTSLPLNKSTYEISLPNTNILSSGDGYILMGRASQIDERGTPSDENDDEEKGSVFIHLIRKEEMGASSVSLDLAFLPVPEILKPEKDKSFDGIPDIEWEHSLSNLSVMEFSNHKRELLWRIVLENEKKFSPSMLPAGVLRKIRNSFPSTQSCFLSVYAYPVDLSQLRDVYSSGEWVLHEKGGYSFFKGRRFYLK